ncbi:MAG: phosphoglyceromutase [Candidatus Latescibacteria bacterium]|jgi:hypothetical protein|nr:phosphoglyceromutase [Candidatus Latescibacterota bacterium]
MRVTLLAAILMMPAFSQSQELDTRYVFLITFDGLRWQEVFSGADGELIENESYVTEVDSLKADFWAEDPQQRRQLLMPFFWSQLDTQGRIYGNRMYRNKVDVTNEFLFSYPGYNEILTGSADARIDSNNKVNNRNTTVLELINRQPYFRNTVAAFGSWDVFPYIINEQRSGIPVNAGFEAAEGPDLTERERTLNLLQAQIPSPWSTVRLDAFTHNYALESVKRHTPRLVFIAYGETDDFAHDGRYDAYLRSAHRTDQFIGELWRWVQTHEPYRNKTTFLITTDHGRGTAPIEAWKDHGADIDGSDQIWFAVIGPDTKSGGEITSEDQYYQNQFARTVTELLGLDLLSGTPAGKAIPGAMGK